MIQMLSDPHGWLLSLSWHRPWCRNERRPKFDIRTGEVLCDPVYEGRGARHNIRVMGSHIEVEI